MNITDFPFKVSHTVENLSVNLSSSGSLSIEEVREIAQFPRVIRNSYLNGLMAGIVSGVALVVIAGKVTRIK